MNIRPPTPAARPRPLRVGYLPLTDAAPLLMARARNLFARHGLRVELSCEVGWATIRDKILYRELDAAHAPAGMLFATQLGLECPSADVLTALILNLHGDALTLSSALWDAGVRDAATLREEVRRRRGERRLTFGTVFTCSSHHVLLRGWLRAAGVNPDGEVRIVIVPPAQMFRNLAAGTIDGYCVGEPWNSLAVRQGAGRVAAWSAAQAPGHIEKVLMVRADFAEKRPDEHRALVAALAEAGAWCDEPQNRAILVDLLARPENLNLPADILAPALVGPFDCGDGRTVPADDFLVFHRDEANAPTQARGAALLRQLIAAGLVPPSAAAEPGLPGRLFREDLYRHAITQSIPHEIQTA